jgi:hypothetical protein
VSCVAYTRAGGKSTPGRQPVLPGRHATVDLDPHLTWPAAWWTEDVLAAHPPPCRPTCPLAGPAGCAPRVHIPERKLAMNEPTELTEQPVPPTMNELLHRRPEHPPGARQATDGPTRADQRRTRTDHRPPRGRVMNTHPRRRLTSMRSELIPDGLIPLRTDLLAHKLRTGRGGDDLVFGRTATLPFVPSTVRRRAIEAWEAGGLAPIALHECRHTAASEMRAAGLGLQDDPDDHRPLVSDHDIRPLHARQPRTPAGCSGAGRGARRGGVLDQSRTNEPSAMRSIAVESGSYFRTAMRIPLSGAARHLLRIPVAVLLRDAGCRTRSAGQTGG